MARYSEMLGVIAIGCDRLVHPSILDDADRLRHRRLIGMMFCGSFFAAGSAGVFVASGLGPAIALSLICAACVAAWTGAVLVAATGRDEIVRPAALMLGAVGLAALISAGGGLASPLCLLLAAPPFEAFWLRRTVRSALWGGASAVAAIALVAFSGSPFAAASISA
ncbi:MAG: PAS domain-containing sensor histidine kinase, partial [Pseudaminobacter sp.]|nr:PAS domain-containing sensor histidine kinase [Pseudaminobacter sp.]